MRLVEMRPCQVVLELVTPRCVVDHWSRRCHGRQSLAASGLGSILQERMAITQKTTVRYTIFKGVSKSVSTVRGE